MTKVARVKLVFTGSQFGQELGIFRTVAIGPDGPPQIILCGEKGYIARDATESDEQGEYLVYDEGSGVERVA